MDTSTPPVPTTCARWQDRYIHRFYHARPLWVGGTDLFHGMIDRHASAERDVLEIGPGPSSPTTRFLRTRFGGLDGLDVDPDVASNTDLTRSFVYDGGRYPLPDTAYDLVVADYVLKHVADPPLLLPELARVLRPGGHFLFRTPNTKHYVAIVSRLSPHWFHQMVAKRLRDVPTETHDPYPTFYRMNSARVIRRLAAAAGLQEVQLEFVEREPSYGLAARPLFLAFMAYERLVNATRLLQGFRSNLFGAYAKGGAA